MPKFSAYMRGEEGPQGDVGQAVLLNGIVSSSSELPPNTQNQKNLVYYVGDEQEGYHLYVYTTTEAQWIDLGNVKGQKGDTGPAAGFAPNQNYEIFAVDPDAEPQISIIPDPNSPDTTKVFNFTFGLPRGQNAGFNQNQNIEIENVDTVQEMYASVSTDENSPNTAKIFNFKFGIPRGEAADFGEPTASISTISSLSTASVSITSSGSATSKIFDFHFDIPQGQKGDRGDSFSIYEPVAFTTGSEYWVDNTTFVYPRGDNSKLPIYIYNEDTDELDNSSFTFTDTDIVYNSEQPFNGTLYLMAGANRPTINIGEVSTTSFDGQMSASLNERSTSSDAIIDFILAKGPDGESGGFGEVTSTAELIPSASTYIEKDSIVSFSTDYDINDVTVDIEPAQDLHGYDHPWPAGGGANLLPKATQAYVNTPGVTVTIADDGTITLNGTATATGFIDVPLTTPLPIGNYSISFFNNKAPASGNRPELSLRKSDVGSPVSESWITSSEVNRSKSFTSTNVAYYWRIQIANGSVLSDFVCKPMLVSGSTPATSYAPYSNICPISGWTGCNVQKTGINIWDEEWEAGSISWATGMPISSEDYVRSKNIIPVKPNTTYFVKTILGTYNINIFYYDKTDTLIGKTNPIVNNTFTTPSLCDHIRFRCQTTINISNDISINYPSTDTDYHTYQGITYPISWSTQAGMVYGGSLDVTTGVLTVDWRSITLIGAETEDWKISNTGTANWYYITKNNILTALAKNNSDNIKTNLYPWASVLDVSTANGFWGSTNNGAFRVRWGTEDTIVNWRNFLASNPLHIVYKTSEPLTYQLTPTQITALLGQNNIWADTGDVQVSYNKFNQPYVEITTDEDSPNTAKRFNFHFGIPQGEKGAPGDAFAIYEPLSFTTGSSYWMGNTLVVPRGDNNKLPLFIYNRDNNNIAATFKLENNYIRHDADSPFNGTLYMMSQTNRSTLRIGNVSTTTYGNGSHFSLNEASTSTDAVFDVVLEQGPRGETALSARIGRVSYTTNLPNVEIEGEQDLVFNFDLPRGFKGEKGDTFTVDVDETIDVLGYNETPIVETTSTSTGIALKFKLPPSVSAQLGDLSQLNTISVTSNYITGILPVNKGGIGVNQLTTNAIILGNNTAIKQKATSAGAFYASGNNVEPGFGTLPITYGGTGTTTFTANAILLGNGTTALKTKATANGAFFATSVNAEPSFGTLPIEQGGTGATNAAAAWTALGGGASGKHPDSYFALASHGTHVSYGTTATAIATTAKAGTAGTLSRSDHVHNITLATGDTNGTVKIAGQNVAVKGLDSAAYTKSTAYAAASHTHNYAGSSSPGGAATSLANFENNNSSGKNANNVTYNAITYYNSNGPATSLGASTNDGALYSQAWSNLWVGQIAQDYRNGNLFTRGKNGQDWTAWKAVSYGNYVLDSGDNSKKITFNYSDAGLTSASWFCVWNGYSIRPMNASNMRTNLGGICPRPDYSYGTTELTPGVSNLETGKLYFVYE